MRSSIAYSLLFAAVSLGQTGGPYDLKHSVIAGGGGASAAGQYSLTGTIGQPVAGTKSTSGQFSVTGGFLVEQALAPTAAGVRISGRVRTPLDHAIGGAIVTLTAATGEIRTVRTNSFGNFRFDGVVAGETYILQVSARRHSFEVPVLVLDVSDSISGISFVSSR